MADTKKELAGPNVALLGPGGTGKTTALGTLGECPLELFYLDLETGLESLIGYYTSKGKPVPPNIHWHKIDPAKKTFKEMAATATQVNTLDMKTLANMQDLNRNKHNLFIKILEAMNDFPDDRTGKKFGAVDSWGPDKAIIIDGLTGLSIAAMSMVVGGKPIRSQQEWGMAQDQLEGFLRMVCDQCRCWFVLIGHVEREPDEVTGGVKLMPSTLGKKLAPKISPMFSDVIKTVREGTTWTWDTAASDTDVKARNLPWKAGQAQDFKPLYQTWKAKADAYAKEQPDT